MRIIFCLILFQSVFCEINAQDYGKWYRCLLVANHDTLLGKIKPKDEYCRRLPFTVVLDIQKEKQRVLTASDIAELWILNSRDTIKYLSINIKDTQTGRKGAVLCRIIEDGKCQLLYIEGMKNTAALGTMIDLVYTGTFFVYYKGGIWDVKVNRESFFIDLTADYKRLGKEAFAECPQLAYRVETKQKESSDIREIVKEFNNCIANKKN